MLQRYGSRTCEAVHVHDRASHRVRPRVVAHRGASHDFPEHTLEAYQRAFDVGADGIECDVRMTRDAQLVCVHDRRVDRVSDGIGKVSLFTLAELREMQWGSGAFQVLTLRQLLALVADQPASRRIEIAIETKHPNRYAGAVEREVVDQLDWFGLVPGGPTDDLWTDPAGRPARRGRGSRAEGGAGSDDPGASTPARIMSFSEVALQRLSRWAPTVPRVYLVKAKTLRGLRGSLGPVPAGACTVGLDIRIVREQPWLVRRYQARGFAVHAWTVDEPEDVERCVDAGVTAIITNRPALVLASLEGGASS